MRALETVRPAIEAEFATLPATFGRAVTQLQNEWARFIADLDKGTGLTRSLSGLVLLVAGNLDGLAKAARLAGEVVAAALGIAAVAGITKAITAVGLLEAAMKRVPQILLISLVIEGILNVLEAKGAIDSAEAASKKLATAQQGVKVATQDTIPTWEKLTAVFGDAIKALDVNVAAVNRSVTANNAQAQAMAKLTALGGETRAMYEEQARAAEVAAAGAKRQAAALAEKAETEKRAAEWLQISADKMLAAGNALDKQQQKQLQDAKDVALATGEEARASAAAAESLEIEAEKSRLVAETYGDQSQKLSALRADHDRLAAALQNTKAAIEENARALIELKEDANQAAAAVAKLRQEAAAGLATDEEVTRAYAAAGQAAKLLREEQEKTLPLKQKLKELVGQEAIALAKYKDALKDTLAIEEKKLAAAQRQTQLGQQAADIAIAQARAEKSLAQAKGDTKAAREADIKVAEQELAKANALVAGKARELAASQAVAKTKIEEVNASEKSTEQKKLEISEINDGITAKRNEVALAITGAQEKQAALEKEKTALDGASESTDKLKGATEAEAKAIEKSAQNTERYNAIAASTGNTVDKLSNQLDALSQSQSGANETAAEASARGNALQATLEAINREMDKQAATHFADGLKEVVAHADEGAAGIGQMQSAVQRAKNALHLFGEENLGTVQGALDSARGKLQSLEDQAKSAKQSLAGMADNLEMEIARAKGDLVKVAELQYQAQKRQINELEKTAGPGASGKATTLLEQKRQLDIAEARKQEAEARASMAASSGGSSGGGWGGSSGSSGSSGGVGFGGAQVAATATAVAGAVAQSVRQAANQSSATTTATSGRTVTVNLRTDSRTSEIHLKEGSEKTLISALQDSRLVASR